jgi:hypothetical protein
MNSMRFYDFMGNFGVIYKLLFYRNLSAIQDREICCYSISCKEKENIGEYSNTFKIIEF